MGIFGSGTSVSGNGHLWSFDAATFSISSFVHPDVYQTQLDAIW
jgi:hypothetical protein